MLQISPRFFEAQPNGSTWLQVTSGYNSGTGSSGIVYADTRAVYNNTYWLATGNGRAAGGNWLSSQGRSLNCQ